MSIRKFVKDWYKEMFWMAVGAGVAFATRKAIRYISEKRSEKTAEEEIEKMRHNIEELRRKAAPQEPDEEVIPIEKEIEAMDRAMKKIKNSVMPLDSDDLQKFTTCVNKLSELDDVEVINESIFCEAPSEAKFDYIYNEATCCWTDMGRNDYDDETEEDSEISEFLGKDIAHIILNYLPTNMPVYFIKRDVSYISIEVVSAPTLK